MTGAQQRAARLVGLGVEGAEVARIIGVTRQTVWNWNRAGTAFREAVERVRSASAEESVLIELLDAQSEPVRLRAAETLVRLAQTSQDAVSAPLGDIDLDRD